jgi:acetyltransferase-like isoleucine patch superfamily enzyme
VNGVDATDGNGGTDDEVGDPGPGGDSPDRRERVAQQPRPGIGNSMHRWYRIRNPLRVAINYAVILLCRISPSLVLKRVLLRRLGVTVGTGVAFGLESTPDVFWPELITIEDDAIVGYDATILCHEFLRDEYRTGAVTIREGAMIGAGAIVLPGVEIGENAQVAANSLVTDDVPPDTTVVGVPATRTDSLPDPD